MQKMQEIDTKQLQGNPFQMIGKDWMLVTAGDEEEANTMTASWGGVGVMWGKDVAYVFIRQTRYTKEFIDRQGRFSLSFPGEEYRKAMNLLGTVSGRDRDKIAESGMNVAYEEGVPYIQEADTVMICKALSATDLTMDQMLDKDIEPKWYADGNIHTMYVAEIEKVMQKIEN